MSRFVQPPRPQLLHPPIKTDPASVRQNPSPNPHPFVCLARDAIALYVESRQVITPLESCYEQFEILRRQSGVFVTLKKSGELRGCMGTLEPACANMALEIIENAISAAFRDPRFCSVNTDEVADLSISIDVVKPLERVLCMTDLNPSCYGVVVRQGMRRGLLLPGITEITSVEAQVAIAREKGAIGKDENIELFRFEVDRYH